jgi:hypothetical protein
MRDSHGGASRCTFANLYLSAPAAFAATGDNTMKHGVLPILVLLGSALGLSANESRAYAATWGLTQVPGCGLSIAGDPTGMFPYVVGCTSQGDAGQGIFQYNGSSFQQVGFQPGVDVTATNSGDVWIIDKQGNTYELAGGGWLQEPPCATSIGSSGSSIFITGCSRESSGGMGIYEWNGDGAWNQMGGQATQVIKTAVDGVPWIINAHGQIYQWNGSGWTLEPGCATSISGGLSSNGGSPWIVGCTSTGPTGNGVYSWNGSGWTELRNNTGALIQACKISLGTFPWSIDCTGAIFQWSEFSGGE